MLLVKTRIGPSTIHGAGLFADECIPKGTRMWELDPAVDHSYTKEEVERLPEPKRSELFGLYHSYINKYNGHYVDCTDGARFMNHAVPGSIVYTGEMHKGEPVAFAARDIRKGEEITIDYNLFAEEGANF